MSCLPKVVFASLNACSRLCARIPEGAAVGSLLAQQGLSRHSHLSPEGAAVGSLLALSHLISVLKVLPPQWGAADAEIKVPSVENTELIRSPFKAWSRSVYSHTCCVYCQGFLSCLFLHFPVHLPVFCPKPLPIFPCVGCG